MSSNNQKSVLIVEDESDTVEMFSEMLKLGGYRIIKCYGGAEAMEILMVEKPDALVLDIMMPDVSGLDVLRFVRSEPELKDTPVIIISAKSLPSDIKKAMDAGASIYLAKPVAYVELKKALEATIGLSTEIS